MNENLDRIEDDEPMRPMPVELTTFGQQPRWRRYWRRFWRVGLGSTVVLVGVALCVLPGPGIATILVGLAIMADEVPPAERLMNYLKARAKDAHGKIRDRNKRGPREG